eukprot:5119370-Pleurochrysis_carterae.AAC.1
MSLSSLKSSASQVYVCVAHHAPQSALGSAAGGQSLAYYRSNHYRSTVICCSTTDHHATNRLYIRTAVSMPTFY